MHDGTEPGEASMADLISEVCDLAELLLHFFQCLVLLLRQLAALLELSRLGNHVVHLQPCAIVCVKV